MIITQNIATLPPKTAEKKLLNRCKLKFATKCPSRLQGAITTEYLKDDDIKLNFKFGTAFLIFFKFK